MMRSGGGSGAGEALALARLRGAIEAALIEAVGAAEEQPGLPHPRE